MLWIFVMNFVIVLLIAALALSPIRTIDGDSVKVDDTTHRLICIDAPEKEQWKGQAATQYLRSRITSVQSSGKQGYYGRELSFAMRGHQNLNVALVKEGLAYSYYLENCPIKETILEAEREARREGRGVWKFPDNCRPWDYRRGGCDCNDSLCIPSPPPDLDCRDLMQTGIEVREGDPHHLDRDGDGIGCEE